MKKLEGQENKFIQKKLFTKERPAKKKKKKINEKEVCNIFFKVWKKKGKE